MVRRMVQILCSPALILVFLCMVFGVLGIYVFNTGDDPWVGVRDIWRRLK